MEIQMKSRNMGKTIQMCEAMLPNLKNFEKVFIAGDIYPQKIIETLNHLGVKVVAEASFTLQRIEPIYDDLFAIEPNIIGFIQEPKKLAGYFLQKIE